MKFRSHFSVAKATLMSRAVEYVLFSISNHAGVLDILNRMPVVDMLTEF